MTSLARRLAALGFGRQLYDFSGGILPPGVGFTRASAGWRFNAAGLLVSETTDVPRFQYDPATLTRRGLLIEAAETNLRTYSESLDDASWVKEGAAVTGNAATAPDGTATMDLIVEDAANTSHRVRTSTTSASFISGAPCILTHTVKAAGRTFAQLTLVSAAAMPGGGVSANFNLGAGTVGTKSAEATAFIKPLGGGLYEISMGVVAIGTSTGSSRLALCSADNISSYLGDGVSGIAAWGAYRAASDCVLSYIPTTSAAVARAADVVLITNPAILGDQCYILKARTPRKISGGAVNVLLHVDDGSTNNNRRIVYGTDGRIHVVATSGGVDQCDLDLGAVANDTDFAVAARFAENNFAASLNGAAVVTDSLGTNPTGLTMARLGRRSDGYAWNSTVRSLESRQQASDGDLRALAA